MRDFSTRLADVGKTLAAQDYERACSVYDTLAADYGVDYEKQGVRPLSAYTAPAPAGAGCDIAEAARRSMRLLEEFQKQAEEKQLGRDAWQRFGDETQAVGLTMQQDPEEACAMIERIADRHGIAPSTLR